MPQESSDWQSAGIFAFPIDAIAVLAHMRQDMRDDWFSDAIDHKDLFANHNDLREVIVALLLEGNGRYEGAARYLCDIPKKGLGIRYSLETDFYDRFIYQAICTYLIPFFDPLLSPRILGHRYNKRRTKEKYLFKNRIELWQTFEGVTYTAITDNQTLLVTDLINYFENITVDIVRSSFESLIPSIVASGPDKLRIRNAISSLCNLLCRWGYSERHGLPQNRDPSSFIANVVLNAVDRRMVERGYDYYRYVDDIRIICPDEISARRALIDLVGELRTVGMNINSSKTKVLTAESSVTEITDSFPYSDDRSVAIDNMWRSRSRRVIARSAQYIAEILRDCIEAKETQSRQFRFAVNRLLHMVDANIFDVQSTLAKELLKLIIDSFEDHPASTDQYCRLLSSLSPPPECLASLAQFLCDERRAIHSWQNYHLWLTLARCKYKTETVLEAATDRMQSRLFSPEIPAIFIYLTCIEEHKRLLPLVPQFHSSWPYRHQRHFLLATRGLEPSELKSIVDKLGVKVRNTARRAASYMNNEGKPLADRDAPHLIELYDEISAYD